MFGSSTHMKTTTPLVIALTLVCFAFSPQTQAVNPPLTPDPGGKPLSNTADGANALLSITTGVNNTAVGAFALFSNVDGSNNTAVGESALLTGNAGGDTAIGFSALQADNGGSNTATGFQALLINDIGFNNAAFGVRALESNTTGVNNTAVGNLALDLSNGSDNVALGRHAGDGITTANNNIVIGHGSGVDTALGQLDNSCYVDNIANQPISAANFVGIVGVDIDGKLGTFSVDANGNKVPVSSLVGHPQAVPKGAKPQAIPDAQALNRKVEALVATVAELRGQLKEQAAQIQKVSAQLEVSKPAAQ